MMDVRLIISGIAMFILMKYPTSSCLDISIHPSTVCYQEHEDVVLRCTFSDNNTTDAKFVFKPRDRSDVVHQLKSVVVNSDTIETRIDDVTIPNNTGTYFCTRDADNKRQITYIEGSVVLPGQIQCYFDESHLSVICEWIGGNATCWNLSIVNAGMGVYETVKECNVSTICNGLSPLTHCVQARYETQTKVTAVCPVPPSGESAIDFKLTGVKMTSTASKVIHKVLDCSTVKLSVSAAHIQNSSTHSVLAWRTNSFSLKTCDCDIQCVITTNNSAPITVNQKCSSDNLFMVTLEKLQETKAYSSTIRCHVISSDVWSDDVYVTFTTPLTAPLTGPLVGQGGYDMYVCQKDFYCLALYWKVLEENISRFKILVSDRTQSKEFIVPNSSVGKVRIPKTSICQQFNISIYSVNSVGKSQNATILQVADPLCGRHRPTSCAIHYSKNSHGYSVIATTPCIRDKSCDIIYYWCQGTKHGPYVDCQSYVNWTKANRNDSSTLIPLPRRKGNGTVYIGVVVSQGGQSDAIDWDVCLQSTDNQANTRTTSESYILFIIPIFPIILILLGILLKWRGGLREKLWNVLKKCSRRNTTSLGNNQESPSTQNGILNAGQMSDTQMQSLEGYYEPVDSNIYHSIPSTILSTDTADQNLNSKCSVTISGLDQAPQTYPKSVSSITTNESSSNGLQSQESTYMDVNVLCHNMDNSETYRKTVMEDYDYCKVGECDGFSENSETFEKKIGNLYEASEHDQVFNNMDYIGNMECWEDYSPITSMCSNRSISSEKLIREKQLPEDLKIPKVLLPGEGCECEHIPITNQSEQVELQPVVHSVNTDNKDSADDRNASKEFSSENNRKTDLLKNELELSDDHCNDYVKAEGPIGEDFTTGEFDYVVM
ncbi:uncharacterized protein LOC134269710 [Saccostrea cucullata]|uniref:uncharacterized protein LOC134269710 n=1 Tax=Saccostrea cuccullata TaxID=36930 RepID=UPI002ED133C0